ncbi:MAG: RimK family alpha-L-glutamate ligase [Desulfosalsimonadaceae bacterium]
MDIGVVTVRGDDYYPNLRLLEAAGEKGLSLGLVNPYRVAPWVMEAGAGMAGMEDSGPPRVILPRQGAQIGDSSMSILRHFAAMGIPLVNSVSAIAAARNKFLSMQVLLQQGIRVPDGVFVNSARMLYRGIELLGGFPVVAKKPSGRQGDGVVLLSKARDAERTLSMNLPEPGLGLLLQRFIAPEGRRDLRVLVMGGNVFAAMELEPPPGDFRSNFHVSGQSRAVVLSAGLEKIAVDSARAVGLDIAGVDVIVDAAGAPWVIEVNYSPGFRGLEAATGKDVAAAIVDFAFSYI